MARSRRGSFGLQPRVAPNVSGQIIALAREYVAKRQSNIMDAWRNGGTFEGKKATDDMVLAFWRGEMKDLDPNDPNYEEAKNNVMQLQYGIEQSKADVLHVQGKMSDMEYAGFFLRWAKKVPRNSEFYRTLQKDAAQLIESAKAKSRANGERARTEAFNKFVTTTTARDIAIGDAMTAALTDLSKKTGLSITGNGDELLKMLTDDVKANPDSYRVLLDVIHKGDPQWDGNLTEGYFNQHIKSATQGYDLIADRAQKAGFVSAYASAAQGMAAMSQWGQNLKVWPVAESYSVAENAFLKVFNDPTASQMDIQAASARFSAAITGMASQPGIDAGTKTMLEADAARLIGQDAGDAPSFGSSMLGRQGVDPNMAGTLSTYAQLSAEMAANPTAWAYAPVDKNGQFDPTGQGALGIVPAGAVPPGAQAVMVPGRDGKAVLAMVATHAVYVKDANDPNAAPRLAGQELNYNVGGRMMQHWGYKDAQGNIRWSPASPVADGATTTIDNKGDIYITPAATAPNDPIAKAQQIDAQLGTHIADQLKAQQSAGTPLSNASVTQNTLDPNGHITGSVEVSFNNGVFTATQKANTLDKEGHITATQSTPIQIAVDEPNYNAFSPSRLAAGEVPGTTFSSPLQSSVQASAYTQTADQAAKFASDPAFQQAFLSQTMQTLGTSNIFDPRIAAAWADVTNIGKVVMPAERTPQNAALRADLMYPGAGDVAAAYQGNIAINYGQSGTLRLPSLPSYLKSQNVDMSSPEAIQRNASMVFGQMLPGLGIPQTATGSPAPTVTPTVTPTTITPTATPAPVGITPTPSPSPAPRPAPAPRPKSPYNVPS